MITMLTELCLISLLLFSNLSAKKNNQYNRSFVIDYENDQFLLDGKPFQFIAGSFHYFRAPKQYWRNIFKKMRAAGLNAVTTYVEWSTHEPEPDTWIWDGNADVREFIEIAMEENLFVILRPGPYICGERDLGGLPYWLLSIAPDIKLRTSDERYMYFAERYLNEILKRVKPYFIANGGPIIMVQIENEYGSLKICDEVYKRKLYDIFYHHVGTDAVLFTVDGMSLKKMVCGQISGVYQTIDFGSTQKFTENIVLLRSVSPKGPFVNSEFYTGWLSHWNHFPNGAYTYMVIDMLDKLLAINASINMYMFYGGTNYGFTSGSNVDKNSFKPQLTSYDYDAPINEAGDLNAKYFAIKEIISKYVPLPNVTIPAPNLKKNYGIVSMSPVLDLFSEESRLIFGNSYGEFTAPPTFEDVRLPHCFLLYEADLTSFEIPQYINLTAIVKDRALVYINNVLYGILSRENKQYTLLLNINEVNSVQFLVENQGRSNYGIFDIQDVKGIFNVTFNSFPVGPWQVTGFKLDSIIDKSFVVKKTNEQIEELRNSPQFLVGYFEVDGEPRDTFLNTNNWGKGVAYINGQNLGRYWPLAGPQITLYVPAPFLKTGTNCLVLLELQNVPGNRTIRFNNKPFFRYKHPLGKKLRAKLRKEQTLNQLIKKKYALELQV